jgi:hypothetical protein
LCGYFVEYKNINFAIKEIAQRQRGCGNWDSFVKMTTSAVACRWVWFITCTLHRNLEEGMFAIHFSDLIRFKVRVLIRLPVIQIYLFIKKLKWCCFYKKKKQKSMECNWVFDRILPGQPARSHWIFSFLIFFSTRPGSSSRLARSRINPSDETKFQNYGKKSTSLMY